MSKASKFWQLVKPIDRGRENTIEAAYGIPTVKFDASKVTDTVKANLSKDIALVEEIERDHFDQVYEAVLRSISAGRDLSILYENEHQRPDQRKSRGDRTSSEQQSHRSHAKGAAGILGYKIRRLATFWGAMPFESKNASGLGDATRRSPQGGKWKAVRCQQGNASEWQMDVARC